jgi:hypothetical protein
MPHKPATHSLTPAESSKRPSAAARGYDGDWRRFREKYAGIVPMICERCQYAGPSEEMHLDHDPPLTGPDDPGRLDPRRVHWLCEDCHNEKTAQEDNGFGRLDQ